MNHRKDWDKFFNKEYLSLVKSAGFLTDSSKDLVHHCYLRVVTQVNVNLESVMKNPKAYFKKVMEVEATRGEFKNLYKISDSYCAKNIPSSYSLDEAINTEELWLAIDRLRWFDRKILTLHLQGHNLAEISRETSIPESVLYTSIHRSREKLKLHFK